MIYKCKNCGSALRFDSVSGKLVCEYCGSSFEAANYDEILDGEKVSYETMEQRVYSCSACGAKLMINNVEAASFCAYCGQPTIVFERVSKLRKPDIILPFKITQHQAHALIKEKLKGFFIPDDIRDIDLDVVRGIYIPFSFSDLTYEDKQVVRGKVRKGKSTYTRFFYRHGKARFKSLPVDQSVKFNDESAERLEPFPMNEFKPFDASYLSGFYADCGDEKEDRLEAKIKARASQIFNKKIEETIKAQKQMIVRNNRIVDIYEIKYGMLPVWFFACRRDNITYTIMVNGFTGKVVGAMPFDKPKVALCSTLIGLPLCAVLGTVGGYVVKYLSLIEDDTFTDIIILIIGLISVAMGAAITKYRSFKKSRELTMESAIFELAKDRQEV